jgi:hypothetical protein
VQDLGDPCPSVNDALKVNRGNVSFGKGSFTEITTQAEYQKVVLDGLIPPKPLGQVRQEWNPTVAEEWPELDDELPIDTPHIDVWATINGARVVLLTPEKGSVHPVLFDSDEGNFVDLPLLAEASWFSESDGAPISWDGGARISELYDGTLWREAWGDTRQEAQATAAYGPVQTGEAVAEMLLADDLQFGAAWALEELDVDDELDAQETLDWVALGGSIEISVTLNLEPGEELPACRTRLRKDPGYVAVAEALAHPTSARGQRLRAKLESVNATGVLGDILGYSLGDL